MSSDQKEFLDRIEKHKGVIFKISRMYMENAEDQKDLFQEITYQAWKSYPKFEGRSEFSTWLYRIAINTAIIFLKSDKKRDFIQNGEVQNLHLRSEEYNDENDLKLNKMYAAIQKLNPIDKAFIFYYLEVFFKY